MNKIKSIKFWVLGLVVAAGIFSSGCSDNFSATPAPTGNTVADAVEANDSLQAFSAALTKVGLYGNFDNVNGGQFTLFGFSNYAFIQYLRSIGVNPGPVTPATAASVAVNYINNNVTYVSTPLSLTGANGTKSLTGIVTYGIISSAVPTSIITTGQGFTTMQGARLSLSHIATATYPYVTNADVASSGGSAGANVIIPDLTGVNGVVHVVDRVMTPVTTASIWDKTLLNFSVNYTVSPIAITMTSGSSTITLGRDGSGNFDISTAPTDASDGNNNLFSAMIIRAGVATTLEPNVTVFPDFTVFAPTDGALRTNYGWASEAAGITAINGMTPAALAALVNYYVVSGRVLTSDLADQQLVTTLATSTFKVNVSAGTYTLTDNSATTATDATISGPNKLTNAGIVHVINQVLLAN